MEKNTNITASINKPIEGNFSFMIGEKEIVKLASNGDIFIKEKLVENDKELVEGLREWLLLANKEKETIYE